MNTVKLQKLRAIVEELEGMPYGINRNNKTFPPNLNHYSRLIDTIIDCLLLIEHPNIGRIIEEILSIKYNELRTLMTSKSKSFELTGVYDEMESISNRIHMHLGELLDKH